MSQNEQDIEWYLARDGQRHGPISDPELRKFIELGHLKPTDLVWRQGFANWEQAGIVFPATAAPPRPAQAAPQPPSPSPPQAAPQAAPQPAPQRPSPQPSQQHAPQQPSHQPAAPQEALPQPSAPQQPMAPQRPMAPQGAAAPVRPAVADPAPIQQAAPGSASPAAGPGEPGSPPPNDPLQHRRVPQQAATRRASGYGDMPPYAQPPYGTQAAGPGTGQPAAPAAGPASGPAPMPSPHPAAPGRPMPAGPMMHGPAGPGPAGTLAAPRPMMPPQGTAPADDGDIDDDPLTPERKRRYPWVLATLLLLVSVAGGAFYGLVKTGRLDPSALPFVSSWGSGAKPLPARPSRASFKETPLKGYASTAFEVDANFQKSGLWQLLKAEFPDWYKGVVDEASKMKAVGADDNAISLFLMQRMVELRRKNAALAFAANPAALRNVAQTFIDNLGALTKVGTDACYRFISAGETDPKMIELMRSPEHTTSMQLQIAAVIAAIVDGRKTQNKITPADRKDYDVLAAQLALRGWSPADLALFDDARALAQAPQQKVCQMVQDWFAAQLSVKDQEVQTRLFGATLKPLIGD